MSRLLIITILFSLGLGCKAPQKVVQSEAGFPTIMTTSSLLEVDALGNIYVVDQSNKLTKYDPTGKELFNYNSRKLGSISVVDVTNPLQVLVFHNSHGIIKILDTTLSEVKSMDLSVDSRYVGVEQVCLSNDGNVWVFDPTTQKILKINSALKSIAETNTLNDLGISNSEIKKIREAGNVLIGSTNKVGFLTFDNFGQFIKKIPASGILDYQFDGQKIIYQTMTSFRFQKLKFDDFSFLGLPKGTVMEKVKAGRKSDANWVFAYEDRVEIIPYLSQE